MAIEKQKLLYTFLNVVWFITLQSLCTIAMVIAWPLFSYSRLDYYKSLFPWNLSWISISVHFMLVFVSSFTFSTTIYEHVKYEDIEGVLTAVTLDVINFFTVLYSISLKKIGSIKE